MIKKKKKETKRLMSFGIAVESKLDLDTWDLIREASRRASDSCLQMLYVFSRGHFSLCRRRIYVGIGHVCSETLVSVWHTHGLDRARPNTQKSLTKKPNKRNTIFQNQANATTWNPQQININNKWCKLTLAQSFQVKISPQQSWWLVGMPLSKH